MRNIRKLEEDKYINIFVDYLVSTGVEVIINEDITDRPDLLFVSNGKTIACELTNIGLPELQKWHRLPLAEDGELDEINIPFEPEYWGLEVLKRKHDPKYEVSYDELWLLIHIDKDMMILYEEDYGIDNVKRLAYFFYAYCESGYYAHKINRVYLALGDKIILLWNRGDKIHMSKYINVPPPMITISQSSFMLTKNGLDVDVSKLPKKIQTLEPLNKNFRLRKS